jgi:hypothetical protein
MVHYDFDLLLKDSTISVALESMVPGQECQAERDEGDSEEATAAEACGDAQRGAHLSITRKRGRTGED